MVILVTGTLVPGTDVFALQLTDRDKRITEYAEGLKELLRGRAGSVDKVVFCENSGDEPALQSLREQLAAEMTGNRLEILSFQGDHNKVAMYGKGYGEGEIINYALANSRILKNEEEFVKLTGRVTIENLDAILKKMKKGTLYFNPVKIYGKDKQTDTKFYKLPIKVYERYFSKLYRQVRDKEGIYIEHLFWGCLKENRLSFRNTPEYPRYKGTSGSVGISYGTSEWKYQIKNLLCKRNWYRNQ